MKLSEITTFKIGGELAGYKIFSNIEELEEIIKEVDERKLPLRILGGGSNILANDEDLEIFVAHNKIDGIEYIDSYVVTSLVSSSRRRGSRLVTQTLDPRLREDDNTEEEDNVEIRVGSGVLLDELADETTLKNLWGLENLKLIPGTVGGACVQNAGAYGLEIKDILFSVTVFDTETKTIKELMNSDCNFSYRDSIFKSNKNLVILYATFSLSKIPKPILNYVGLDTLKDKENLTSLDVANKVKEIRMSKLPNWQELGTAGSFFKNSIVDENKYQELLKIFPELKSHKTGDEHKLYAGQIIELAGFKKGTKEGEVGLYKDNALVVVNHGSVTYQEIKSFVKNIQDKVKEKFGIILEQEVEEL